MRLPFCVIDKKIDFRHTTGAYCVIAVAAQAPEIGPLRACNPCCC
jgi:hypothetical protein